MPGGWNSRRCILWRLFRSLPGFNVATYGQGAIGYGMAMRGFSDGDHGRDIAYFIDGVPVNEISSIHTPNYADLNILIPETVSRIEVIRGPFSVEAGNSNLGGSVFITTQGFDPYASLNLSPADLGGRGAGWRPMATYTMEALCPILSPSFITRMAIAITA